MIVPLPVGTRLLHIGPPKTGTSSLQGAFHTNRERLEALGVHYAGALRQQRIAAAAIVKDDVLPGNLDATLDRWPDLVDEVTRSEADRVVISAEMFANAGPDRIPAITDAFGPRTHVVVTLRPLVRLLPSQWQQYVQSGLRAPYQTWLVRMLEHPGEPTRLTPTFWQRHRHDALVARWADVVGPERVTVVALDEADRGMNLRVFESLLGLPAGTLVTDERSNRSLTVPEITLALAVNRRWHERGWPKDAYYKVVRPAFHTYLKSRAPAPDEPLLQTPRWAQVRADEIAEDMVARLRLLEKDGVTVIGDLDTLRLPPEGPPDTVEVDHVDVGIAADAVISALQAAVIEPRKAVARIAGHEPVPQQQSTRDLLGELRRRALRKLPFTS
jgi:hypothetical protein